MDLQLIVNKIVRADVSGLFHFVVGRATGLHENKEHYLQEAGKRGLAHSETDKDRGFIRS